MYSRVNIKERAKAVLRANYWPLVGFFLIVIILTGGNSSLTSNFRIDVKDLDHNLFSKEMIERLRKVAIGASALGILAGHVPFVTVLKPAECHFILPDSTKKTFTCGSGLLLVEGESVTVLSSEIGMDKQN